MAIAFAGVAGGARSYSLTVPTLAAGDLMLCAFSMEDSGNAPVLPSGWTILVGGDPYLAYKTYQSSDAGVFVAPGGPVALCAYSGVEALGQTAPGNTAFSQPPADAVLFSMAMVYATNPSFPSSAGLTERTPGGGLNAATWWVSAADSLGNTLTYPYIPAWVYGGTPISVVLLGASPPGAPSLTSPPNGQYVDATDGVSFAATYNSTDSASANARAMRLKLASATAYSYYSTSAGAFQSTIVWNPVNIAPGASAQFGPVDSLTNQGATNWSMADQESNANSQGPFAADFTVNLQLAPSLTINFPTGTEAGTNSPPLEYTATPANGASIIGGQSLIYPIATTQASGFSITIPGTIPSGAVSNVTFSGNPQTVAMQSGVILTQGQTYVCYAAVQETGPEWSPTVSSTFTINLDQPAAPSVAVSQVNTPAGSSTASIVVTGNDNLLSATDASFESSIGTWFGVNADLAQGQTGVVDGAYSLAIQGIAAGPASAQSTGYDVVPGNTYSVMGVWTAASSASEATLNLVWLDSSGSPISQASSLTLAPSSSGVQFYASGVAPSNAVSARPQLYIENVLTPQLPAPAAPTVTPEGTAGTTTYPYQITATNSYGTTTASPTGSTTTGNATLGSTNYNLVAWTAVTLPVGSAGNLVYDSNLTQATASVGPTWTPYGGAVIGTGQNEWSVVNAGSDSAEIVYTGNGSATPATQVGLLSTPFPVTPGSTYVFSCYINATNGNISSVGLEVAFPTGSPLGYKNQTAGEEGLVSLAYTPEGGTTEIAFMCDIYELTVPAGETVSWSQIQVTETSSVQPYAPGPLWTYDVYRDNALIGSTTALAFEDTGQTATTAAPTANTSGQPYFLDAVGIFPGSTPNMVYDSNLTMAIAFSGGTLLESAAFPYTFGTADGNFNVLNAGTPEAEVVYYGTGSAAPETFLCFPTMTLAAGTYTLSALMNAANSGSAGDMNVALWEGASPVISATAVIAQAINETGSAIYSNTVTVPAGEYFVAIGLNGNVVAAGDTLSWSQIQLTQGSTVQPYQPGLYWTAGGFAGNQQVIVTRSDGFLLRQSPQTVAPVTQQCTFTDSEIPIGFKYTYEVSLYVQL